jgi:hypothetical protein
MLKRDPDRPPEADLKFLQDARDTWASLTERSTARLRQQADALRVPIDLSDVRLPEPLPPLEAIAIGEVRESVERLAQITAAQAEQLATLVEIGNAQHQDGRSAARLTIGLTAVLVALTVAIVVLTYVLVAEALAW